MLELAHVRTFMIQVPKTLGGTYMYVRSAGLAMLGLVAPLALLPTGLTSACAPSNCARLIRPSVTRTAPVCCILCATRADSLAARIGWRCWDGRGALTLPQ